MNVTTTLEVAAGHRLLDYTGLCKYLHGHNYVISVTVNGVVDDMGFVVDFKDLRRDLKEELDRIDHAMMLHEEDTLLRGLIAQGEKIVSFNCNPTAENIASWLFTKMQDRGYKSTALEVRETANSCATATRIDRTVIVK